jgi:MFS transporter, DHA1 family, tetracycline resistance protein
MTHASRPPALVFIFITLLLNSAGFGLIMPVLPSLLEELTGLTVAEAARWGGYLSVTYAVMNFVAGPVLGSLSDRFGRRPVLLGSLAMMAVDYMIMALATTMSWLFIGRLLTGISGATFSTANAYIADITEPENRARAFGMMGAAFGIGFILGPALGGLLGEISPRAPFYAAAALAALNVVFGIFVLPESLKTQDRRAFDILRANPFGAFRHFSKLPKVAWFLIALFAFQVAHFVFPSTWNFHGEARYGWSSAEIGLSLMAVGVGSAFSQAVLIGPLIKHFGPTRTAALGLAATVLSLVGFALASEGWMTYAILPLSALGGVATPALNALMSNQTPRNAQGELQGAIGGMQAMANIASPLLMTQVFASFSSGAATGTPLFGAAFALAAGLTVLAFIPFVIGVRRNRAA